MAFSGKPITTPIRNSGNGGKKAFGGSYKGQRAKPKKLGPRGKRS